MGRIYHLSYLFVSLAFLSSAFDTHDKWSSVCSNNSLTSTLPSCAQPCVVDVDASLNCWSYGCVCSERTLGANFINGTRSIETCVSNSCIPTANAALSPALDAFQSICSVTLIAMPTANASVTVIPIPVQTPVFNGKE
jgi:CFEM domain